MKSCFHIFLILTLSTTSYAGTIKSLSTTITVTVAPNPNAVPTWVSTLTPGIWKQVSLNTLSNVDPENDPLANPNYPSGAPWRANEGQPAVVEDWCGGALATGKGKFGSYIAYCGGHQGYYGNEVYAFDLETLKWSRLSNPYKNPKFSCVAGELNYPEGRFPDGSPVKRSVASNF